MTSKRNLSQLSELTKQFSTKKERVKVAILVLSQMIVNLLDLVGVAFLGLVGALTVSGVQSKEPSGAVLKVLDFLNLASDSFQFQVGVLASVGTATLVSRTLISLKLSRITFHFFGNKSVEISALLLGNLFKTDSEKRNKVSSQETVFAITNSCDILLMGVFAQSTILVSDLTLLIVMGIAVIFVQPATAFVAFLVFGFAGLIMHFVLNRKSKVLGSQASQFAIENMRMAQELIGNFREIYAANKNTYFVDEFYKARRRSTRVQTEINYLPIVNKYFLESALLIGGLSVAAVEFVLHDAKVAMSGLALFLAAGSRIAPALLRVQQNFLNIRNSLGGSEPTLTALESISTPHKFHEVDRKISIANSELPSIEMSDCSFAYEVRSKLAIDHVSISVPSGKMIALIGPSGSGKSTLVDLMLGILKPQSGEVFLGKFSPRVAISESKYRVAYVPQEVKLISGSLLENIALGTPLNLVDVDRVREVIAQTQLGDLLTSLPHGLETQLGEEGTLMSGGQKQRLGIARALYQDPQLLILDEPTSALDAATESLVADSLDKLKGEMTIVLIAHRLNTLRNVDLIYLLEEGRLIKTGTFQELQKEITGVDL